MAALEFGECVPMTIEQTREDFRFHFALLQLFIALLVARIVLAVGIHRRHEYDVLTIWRPDRAVSASGNVRDLMRLAGERTRVQIEIAHPDLRRIGCFRGPDEPFAVG